MLLVVLTQERPLEFTCLYLEVTLSHLDHLHVSLESARPGYSMHPNSLMLSHRWAFASAVGCSHQLKPCAVLKAH